MTKKRQRLLEYITQEEVPVNAAQIHKALPELADLATIYRGLQYLEGEGYLSSFTFECRHRGIERYYHTRDEDHLHFMHCHGCHKFIPIPYCPFGESLAHIEEESGFLIEGHTITLTGLCRSCQNKE